MKIQNRNDSIDSWFESFVNDLANALLAVIMLVIFLSLAYLVYTSKVTLDHVWTCEYQVHWLSVERVCTGAWTLNWHW